jgi:hypothetical protein
MPPAPPAAPDALPEEAEPAVALPLLAEPPAAPAPPFAPFALPPEPVLAVFEPPMPAAPAPPVPDAPLALPRLVATLPMFVVVLPDTEPVRVEFDVAEEVLKLFEKFAVAVPPLLAAAAPAEDAVASPVLLLLLSVL